jgi:nucleoside-diphosphate-sugar epimerase
MNNKNHHILVTGGTGFLGSHVIKHLISLGYKNIHSISRALPDEAVPSVNYHICNILDLPELEEYVNQADYIIHTAGIISYQKKDYKKMFDVNEKGTENLLNLSLLAKVKKFVHVSSTAAFGNSGKQEIIDESYIWNNKNHFTQYGLSKHLAEMQVWRAQAEGLSTIILSPSMMLGAGDWKRGTASIFNTIYKGLNYYPSGINGLVSVKDVADLACKYMANDIDSNLYIVNAENLSYKDLFRKIATAFDKKIPARPIQGISKYLALVIDFWKSFSLNRDRHLSLENLRNTELIKTYDNQKLLKDLSYTYTGIDETVQGVVQQYLQEKKKA